MSIQTQIKIDIHKRLDAMHTARATWEEGTLRASNDELYAILESVYDGFFGTVMAPLMSVSCPFALGSFSWLTISGSCAL